jgi:hypothetical protein
MKISTAKPKRQSGIYKAKPWEAAGLSRSAWYKRNGHKRQANAKIDKR